MSTQQHEQQQKAQQSEHKTTREQQTEQEQHQPTLSASVNDIEAHTNHIMACNEYTCAFGLSLTAEQAHELACSHAQLLDTYERVEFEGNGVTRIIEGFASSFYLEQAAYANTLAALQEKFYELRSEAGPDIFDEEIIDGMRLLFDGDAAGTIELLNACTLDMVLDAYDTQTGSLAQRKREVVGDLTQTSEIPQFVENISEAHVFDTAELDIGEPDTAESNTVDPSTAKPNAAAFDTADTSDTTPSEHMNTSHSAHTASKAVSVTKTGASQAGDTHISAAQAETAHKNILTLFLKLCRLYTGGGSSSVSRAQAYDLLHSLRYVLRITSLDDPETAARLDCDDIEALFNHELDALKHKVNATMELLREARATMPPLTNVALTDTLASIEHVRSVYDLYFAAHAVPVSFDYPLHNPITEPLEGIDYVHEWLVRFLEEARFLAQLDVNECKQVLETACPGYENLIMNLYEPLYRHFNAAS